MKELSADLARRLLERVRAQEKAWVGFVERLARLESPSTDPATQAPVQALLSASLDELGLRVRSVPGQVTGGLIVGVPRNRRGAAYQLLLGHSDTVWPVGTLPRMPVEREGSTLRGPGVFDMKAGLGNIVFALRALHEEGVWPETAPVVLVNSDEEIGSPESTRHILRLARGACRTFVLEPALGLDGKLKTARKGVGRFSVRITGRGAHSGLDPERGASAIQELALLVQSLHALTDLERGIVVNVGQVHGGVRPNVVAAEATAEVDVRVASLDDGRWIEGWLRSLEARVPGCHLEILGQVDHPPLERTPRNRKLWDQAARVAGLLGLDLEEGIAGGASDGNLTSQVSPTLDGLGAVGDGAHAQHEHVDIQRTLVRCGLLACLLLAPRPSGTDADPADG